MTSTRRGKGVELKIGDLCDTRPAKAVRVLDRHAPKVLTAPGPVRVQTAPGRRRAAGSLTKRKRLRIQMRYNALIKQRTLSCKPSAPPGRAAAQCHPAGTAGLKRHISITMEFSSRTISPSLVMVAKVSFDLERAGRPTHGGTGPRSRFWRQLEPSSGRCPPVKGRARTLSLPWPLHLIWGREAAFVGGRP